MTALATVADLQARCDWTFDADETRVALGYLEEASDLARSYGREGWETTNAPRMVKNMVIASVRRFMRNPDGFTTSRAGDETVAWDSNPEAGSIYYTRNEQRLLRTLAGNGGGLRTAAMNAWKDPNRTHPREAWTVPVAGYDGEKAFPYFSDECEPW